MRRQHRSGGLSEKIQITHLACGAELSPEILHGQNALLCEMKPLSVKGFSFMGGPSHPELSRPQMQLEGPLRTPGSESSFGTRSGQDKTGEEPSTMRWSGL